MLEVFINFLCALMMALLGVYAIKRISNSKVEINYSKVLLIIINCVSVVLIHYIKYNTFTSLLNFLINTITYKFFFEKKYSESLILNGILMIIIFIAELIWILILVNFITMNDIRTNIVIYLLTNIIIVISSIIIINEKHMNMFITKVYNILIKQEKIVNTIFIILIIVGVSSLMYNISLNFKHNFFFLSNMLITFTAILITIIYFHSNNNYNKLSTEYDVLLSYVSTFEDWIEQEQFIRHEYKNQLAVLYALSSEKEVKNKIEEIINQNLNIKNEVVNNLKNLPKGGIKGLLYYKTIIAKKSKLKITVNVSIKEKGILSKLSKEKQNTIAKLIGIFYDNAIDAAKESRKKIILLEIYELKDKVNIVFSNTFKKMSIVDGRFEKGVSSKGDGHGNGLYFANKILKDNSWIKEHQEIIDNYYIETITINKKTSKK